ncbi:MAG TPA: adenine deaminase [Desulfitobacterium dehalogenans]|uniref:Adenine deaminase n=1 Tax=Desulfitobacterium dehalogenans TaxID=36854 RepID=A0A7C6Z5N3_9FIRM|nr:adenine deaminase [Desulfitobacterium dehalogenans]
MNYDNLKKLTSKSLGREKAQLVLKNAKVVNVFSEEILIRDVAVEEGMIVGVGKYDGLEEIDLSGKYLCPGFIDAHLHLESTLVAPPELIHSALQWGTTTFIIDPHEVVNVAGEEGLDYMIDQTEDLDANVFLMLPSCVPAVPFEENGCILSAEKMERYLVNPRILGLGEVMDYVSVIEAEEDMVKKLRLFQDRIKDGHAPYLQDKQLAAYALARIKTDHECVDYAYALEEIRNGMQVLIREGSGARNLEAIVRGILEDNMDTASFSFCTDDKHINDIQREGHISYNIKKSIALGIPPIKAIKMATINTAKCYNLTELGAIAPGYQADFVVLDSLEEVSVHSVYHKGKKVNVEKEIAIKPCSEHLRKTVHIPDLSADDLKLAVNTSESSLIQIIEGQITTKHLQGVLPSQDNYFVPNAQYNKVVVVERHKSTGHFAVAPVLGFNLHNGAIATSVSHDSHNIVAIGDNDESILLALQQLQRVQGGYTIVRDKTVLATLPLPIMGLISDAGYEFVENTLNKMIGYAHEMGVPANTHPFIALSFITLPVIPEIRITTRGMYDVIEQKFIG